MIIWSNNYQIINTWFADDETPAHHPAQQRLGTTTSMKKRMIREDSESRIEKLWKSIFSGSDGFESESLTTKRASAQILVGARLTFCHHGMSERSDAVPQTRRFCENKQDEAQNIHSPWGPKYEGKTF